MHLSIDLDGTVWKQDYPNLGDLLPNAKESINYLHSRGHTVIINSCRALHHAENAKAYMIHKGIKYDFFNENDPKIIEKYGSDSRKISSDVYLDDRSLNDIILRKTMGVEAYNEQFWETALEQFQFIEKPCIICIVGESGAGKTLAAEYLENMYDINLIQSYTDRPKRSPDENGHTFLTQTEFSRLEGDVLAYTEFGNHRYCCLTNDLFHINSYVIDEAGLEMLKNEWSEVYDIYSLRIHRPLFDRIENVGEERTSRDVGRFNLHDNEFDFVINNNDNKKEDLFRKLEEFMRVFRLDGRAKEFEINI